MSTGRGDYGALGAICEEIHDLANRLGDPFWIAGSLEGLGEVALLEGDYAGARQYYGESLRIGHEIEHPRVISWSLMGLGDADYETGQYVAARQKYERSLAISREHEVSDGIALSLVRLGNAACAAGDYAASSGYLAQALRFEVHRGHVGAILDVLSSAALLLDAQGQTGEASGLAAFVLQQPETRYQTQERIERLCAESTLELPADLAAGALEKTLEEMCEVTLGILSE